MSDGCQAIDLFLIVETQYPHVADAVKLHWGHNSFDAAINKFLYDTRDGQRRGFPTDVSRALLELSILHTSLFPNQCTDLWSDVDKRG